MLAENSVHEHTILHLHFTTEFVELGAAVLWVEKEQILNFFRRLAILHYSHILSGPHLMTCCISRYTFC